LTALKVDPVARTIPWMYTASKTGLQNWSLFSSIISSAQRLGDGNTLIAEGLKGRIFEVNSLGAIVWEYMSPYAENRPDGGTTVTDFNVYRAYRLPYYWPFVGAPPDGGV